VKDLGAFLPFVLIVAVFWFLVIRPARKRQRDVASVQSSVDSGTQVMLGSGIYGTVTSVTDDLVWLEIAPGTTMKVARQAVVKVVDDPSLTEDTQPRVDSDVDPGALGDGR
jgi:preprotein translocase subunit YajC